MVDVDEKRCLPTGTVAASATSSPGSVSSVLGNKHSDNILKLQKARTVVIKIGTSSITKDGAIDMDVMRALVEDVSELKRQGRNVAVVTSGAVGLGMKSGRDVQVAARVGQPKLMHMYVELFTRHGIEVGQLLLTKDEFATRWRLKTKVVRPIHSDFEQKVVPIINENDGITNRRTTLGDNDSLVSRIACAIGADAFVIMSMKNGSAEGRGGESAKYAALRRAQRAGMTVLLVDGKEVHAIRNAFDGDRKGHENVEDLKAVHRNGQMAGKKGDAKAFMQKRKKVMRSY